MAWLRCTLACASLLPAALGKVYFKETFGGGWEDRWTRSARSDTRGRFVATAGQFSGINESNVGLMTVHDEEKKVYGISAAFDSFSNKDGLLIIQFQLTAENQTKCSSAHLKIGPTMDKPGTFGFSTPYSIMFGPHKCGYTSRTDVVFHYRGMYMPKTHDLDYQQADEGISTLYRLAISPDGSAQVEIDGAVVFEGSIKENWLPEQEDPTDAKPADWVDERTLPDPKDKKPKNWVDEARIPDMTAKKPTTWDDDDDGVWERPLKDNPAYKGKWEPRRLDNPAFKGYWEAKKVQHPEWESDDAVCIYDDLGFVGLNMFQDDGGTIFDNIIITDDVKEADKLAAEWKARIKKEKAIRSEHEEQWIKDIMRRGREEAAKEL